MRASPDKATSACAAQAAAAMMAEVIRSFFIFSLEVQCGRRAPYPRLDCLGQRSGTKDLRQEKPMHESHILCVKSIVYEIFMKEL
jgi:hypothetical protein